MRITGVGTFRSVLFTVSTTPMRMTPGFFGATALAPSVMEPNNASVRVAALRERRQQFLIGLDLAIAGRHVEQCGVERGHLQVGHFHRRTRAFRLLAVFGRRGRRRGDGESESWLRPRAVSPRDRCRRLQRRARVGCDGRAEGQTS
jgi:hypothetical protein